MSRFQPAGTGIVRSGPSGAKSLRRLSGECEVPAKTAREGWLLDRKGLQNPVRIIPCRHPRLRGGGFPEFVSDVQQALRLNFRKIWAFQ
jgi:hypothetical protein